MSNANVYGESFYTLAEEEGISEDVLGELRSIVALFKKNPYYVKILDSPHIAREELMEVLHEDFFGKIHRYTLNFLKILCEKHMVHHIEDCLAEYEKHYNEQNNIKVVKVTTAKPLGEAILEKLIKKLEEKTGGKVVVEKYVDAGCIGGIIIEMDGKQIDSSLKTELSDMKQALTS